MAQRFERLYDAPKNLYALESPVVIESGALSKDNKEKKLLIQVKIKNLEAKVIKGAKVTFALFDTIGQNLNDDVSFDYLDLICEQGDNFGSKTPVYINSIIARSFQISHITLMYSDNTIYVLDNPAFEELKVSTDLKEKLGKQEHKKYVQSLSSSNNNYEVCPVEVSDLWVCSCGAFNKNESKKCYCCDSDKDNVFSLDVSELRYKIATEYKSNVKYEDAIEWFKKIQGYKDSDKLKQEIQDSIYITALKEKEKNSVFYYEEAIKLFSKIIDWKDSAQQIDDCNNRIDIIKQEGVVKRKKTVAIVASIIIGIVCFYLLSVTLVIPSVKYSIAYKNFNKKDFVEAVTGFTELGDFKDSSDKVKQSYYLWGCELLNEKQYEFALNKFNSAGNWSDSVDKLKECNYLLACEEYDKGNFQLAILYFNEARYFKDSAEKKKEAKYGYVKSNYNNDDHTTCEYLTELKDIGYKDTNALYNDLYSWKVAVQRCTTSRDDNSVQSKVSSKSHYFVIDFKITGGLPNESSTFTSSIRWPDGHEFKPSEWDRIYEGLTLRIGWSDLSKSVGNVTEGNMVVSIYEKSTGKYIGGYTLELY